MTVVNERTRIGKEKDHEEIGSGNFNPKKSCDRLASTNHCQYRVRSRAGILDRY